MKPLQNLTQFQFYAFCMHWPICTLRNHVIFVHFQPTQFQTFLNKKKDCKIVFLNLYSKYLRSMIIMIFLSIEHTFEGLQ